MGTFNIKLRIYYEDTDAGGVVYHANYLKYYERCRTDYLRASGFEQDQLAAQYNIVFVVKKMNIDYIAPAWFNDELIVTAKVIKQSKTSLIFKQDIFRAGQDSCLVNSAEVLVVCVNKKTFKPARIPAIITFQGE